MKGFVRNATPVYAHAMKRSIAPNQTVPLDELYEQYGKKNSLAEGDEFVNWLRNVKLKDTDRWHIVYDKDDGTESDNVDSKEVQEPPKAEVKDKKAVVEIKNRGGVAPFSPTKMSVKDVVQLSVRQAREVVPKINDLNLLKYSMQEANQLANKDSLCIILRKRIKEIEISR